MSDKKKILSVVIVVIIAALLLTVYTVFREKPENPNSGPSADGALTELGKDIVIEVVDSKGESTLYELTTHSDYLRGAMDEAKELGFTYGETQNGFGPMVTEVNGESAVYETDGAYWSFYVNDEYCNYGISDQPVNDSDRFSIVYTKA